MNAPGQPILTSITPFFIVRDASASITFYRDSLGFELSFAAPDGAPFFAILRRDAAQIMFKAILPEVRALPNPSRHPWAKWDAYVSTPDPDALASEFASRGVNFHKPLGVDDDNLRGFEVKDPDGYVLFFGRPN